MIDDINLSNSLRMSHIDKDITGGKRLAQQSFNLDSDIPTDGPFY